MTTNTFTTRLTRADHDYLVVIVATVIPMSINLQPKVDLTVPRQKGPGEHKYDHLGSLILPSVAYGTPAQKRDELLAKMLRERIWVHFARAAVAEFIATSSSISSAFTSHVRSIGISSKSTRSRMSEHRASGSKMLPIGVLVAFDIPPANEGGLEAALEQFGEDDVEGLVQHLSMSAKMVEFLLPHIDQVSFLDFIPSSHLEPNAYGSD
jgi:hypothetical protein